jgi:chorismate mutase/prephenate dehydratase
VLARTEPEESGDDHALISLESANGISRNRISAAFDKVGLPGFISALDQVVRGVHHYLVELPGVIAEGDKRLRELEGALGLESGRVAALGAFAVPAVATRP